MSGPTIPCTGGCGTMCWTGTGNRPDPMCRKCRARLGGGPYYWATQNALGSIWQANLDGSNAHVIVAGQSSPYGLAVYGGHLYFASVQDETIYVANLDGTNPQPVVKNLNGLTAMAVDNGHVYWANAQGPLQEVNVDGTNLQIVVTNVPDMYGLAFTPSS